MEKRLIDDIRISMILIQDNQIEKQTKVNNLNKIADILKLYTYGDDHKGEFVKESIIMIGRKQYFKWKFYLKEVLIFTEDYEVIAALRLEQFNN
jgi:hypothetical protein